MKKTNKFVCALVLSMGALLGLASCSGDGASSSERDPEIQAVYQAYVDNGGTLSYEEWLASIKGDKGDKGDTGATGATGAQGEKGEKGDKGDKGDTGEKGSDGTNGTNGTNGVSPTIGDNGNWYIGNEDTGVKAAGTDGKTPTVEINSDGYWVINGTATTVKATGEQGKQGETGAKGADGSSVLTGQGKPDDKLGKDGDSYIDKSTFDYYTKANGTWTKTGNIKGSDGTNGSTPTIGENGNWWIDGKDTQIKAKGEDGKDATDPKVEINSGGYWVINGEATKVKATGEQGKQGETGATGPKGDTGATGRVGFVCKDAEDLAVAATIDNAYIVLATDIISDVQIVVTGDAIIDLNGKMLYSTVRDASAICAYGEDADVLVKNGLVYSRFYGAMSASNHGKLTAVDGLEAVAQEYCFLASDYGQLVIEGGEYTSIDNFVVGTNGTVDKDTGEDLGHNTITINGGTFNGNIESSGYIACGIYVANSDTVTVNAGTFNIANGIGVLSRSGNTTVTDKVEINFVSGSEDSRFGYVGDKKLPLPTGQKIVLDHEAEYPGGEPTVAAPEGYAYDFKFTEVGSVEELKKALETDYSVLKLTSDISVEESIVVTNHSYINLGGKTIELTKSTGNDAIKASGTNAALRLENGTVKSANQGVKAYDRGYVYTNIDLNACGCGLTAQKSATLVIGGGNYTAKNNGVIMTNGTINDTKGDLGHNKITVNGGTFNAKIETTGEIACGIYVANSDTVTVNAGTFNIEDGVGIVARSGSTYVADAVEFNHTTKTGRTLTEGVVGDAKQPELPVGKNIVLDFVAKYPGGTPSVDDAAHNLYVVVNDVDKVATEEALLTKVTAGEPVVLAQDITLSKALDIKKNLSFYGNGHSITGPAKVEGDESDPRVVNINDVTGDISVTFTDTKIVGLTSGSYNRGISLYGNEGKTKLTLNKCEVTTNYYPICVNNYNVDLEVVARKTTLAGYCAAQTYSANTKWTFEDCTLKGINNFEKSDWNDFAMFKVNVSAYNTILNFKNCNIQASSSTGNEENFVNVWAYSELTFSGCTFKHNGKDVKATAEAVDEYISAADYYTLEVK